MMSETAAKDDSLMKRSAWLMFAKVTGFALSFLLPLLIVRYLAQDRVGVYKQIFLVVGNAVSFLPLGFSASAYYFLNREPEKRHFTITNILLFNFVTGGAACLALFLYPQILGNLFQSAEMTNFAPRIGIVIWLWIFSTFLETVALANQETRLATAFIILAQLTKTLLMAGAVVLFATVEAFIYAAMAQAVLQIAVLLFYLNSRFPRFWKSFSFSFLREQIIYAIPFGLAGLLYTIQTDMHNYFVGYKFSEADFAIYSYGCFQLPLVAMLYESFSAVLIPRMSELESNNRQREMFLTTAAVVQRLAFAYFPLFVFLMIVADVFITTLFTKSYAASVPIFRINLLLLPFYCLIIDPVGRAFPAIGRFLLKVRLILFFALFAALYFGIQNFDMRGIIAIVVVAFAVENVVSTAKIIKILELKKSDFGFLKNLGKMAAAALSAGVALLVFYQLTKERLLEYFLDISLFAASFVKFQKGAEFIAGCLFLGICLIIFAAVYLFFVNRLGVITAEDKRRAANLFFKVVRRKQGAARREIETVRDVPAKSGI